MITREMVEYVMLFSKKKLVSALKRNDHNGDWKGITKTVAALTVIAIAIDNEFDLKDLKEMLG